MALPPITFSNWAPWTDRSEIAGYKNPGVYALAHFKKPPKTIGLQSKKIIYIGETCTSFRKRLGEFERSAFKGKKGHSGGKTYREEFGDEKKDQLFVSAFPVHVLSDELRPLFIRYLERKLILEYAMKRHRLPDCNRK